MNIFKTIRNSLKLRRLNKLTRELCNGHTCRNCPAFMSDRGFVHPNCALTPTLDLALDTWALKKEE